METKLIAALYTRVSTDLQEKEQTIASQLEALRAYAAQKGYAIAAEYADNGYSGAMLQRPGLDALRDALTSGSFDLVLFHSPDRLARRALYQEIVLEEMREAGVRPEFLNFTADDSPESQMLLGMQGLFAEYERTKIAERTRRGKLHHARNGALVSHVSPYGYHFVRRSEAQRAHLELDDARAVVVQQMYTWLIEERLSTRAVARRLTSRGIPTSRGANQWQPIAVDRIFRNTAYKGAVQYRPHGAEDGPISIAVPPIVSPSLWEAAQEQLHQNGLHSPRNNKRHPYLLRGLVKCPRCGGSYYGFAKHGRRGYRCLRVHSANSSTGQRCAPGAINAEPLEQIVWQAVTEALQQPDVLRQEYERRTAEAASVSGLEAERKQVSLALKRVTVQEDRITDAYRNEAMDLHRYKAEMHNLQERRAELGHAAKDIDRRAQQELDSRNVLQHLDRFCHQVASGLGTMTFEERQQLLRLVVERVTVKDSTVHIETVIPLDDKLRTAHGEPVEPPGGGSAPSAHLGALRPPHVGAPSRRGLALGVAHAGGEGLVDAPRPLTAAWVLDVHVELPDALHREDNAVAVLDGADALVVRACADQVARIEGRDAAAELDALGDIVGHVAGVEVVALLAVVGHQDVQIVGVRYLVAGDDPRAHGAEGAPRLAQVEAVSSPRLEASG